jgi:hypothetical protein
VSVLGEGRYRFVRPLLSRGGRFATRKSTAGGGPGGDPPETEPYFSQCFLVSVEINISLSKETLFKQIFCMVYFSFLWVNRKYTF